MALGCDERGDRGAEPRARVLLVEDNEDALETLRDLLELKGHAVAGARSGEEALRVGPGFGPNVVLCDLGLPDMSGYELAPRLRQALPSPAHLVALSGYVRSTDRALAAAAGFDEHLGKPAPLDEVDRILAWRARADVR